VCGRREEVLGLVEEAVAQACANEYAEERIEEQWLELLVGDLLLLKEFGGKCSFRDGGALYDGKDTVDFELRKEIQSEFDMIKLARQ
jgi:hypothetical protein